jgi:hypothetical protein
MTREGTNEEESEVSGEREERSAGVTKEGELPLTFN